MEFVLEVKRPTGPIFEGRAADIVREEQTDAVQAGLLVFQGEVVPRTPVAQGFLRGGVQVDMVGAAPDVIGRVFDPVGYAPAVEGGARPHFPPVAPLVLWVQRKLGVPTKEARSVAFLVARAISRRGTKARDFFKGGFNAGKPRVVALFERANARIAQRLGGA